MLQIIISGGCIILVLVLLNAFISGICGFSSYGENGKVFEGALVVIVLYFIFLISYGGDLDVALSRQGIPFLDKLEDYANLQDMFQNGTLDFLMECVELISLLFLMNLISVVIPGNIGGSGWAGNIIGKMILIIGGVIANGIFLDHVGKTPVFQWAIVVLQCFLSGTAVVVTPAMILGKILKLDPKNAIITFLIKELPGTRIGRALSESVTNALVLVFGLMILESQVGSLKGMIHLIPLLVSMGTVIFLYLVGIKVLIKAVVR